MCRIFRHWNAWDEFHKCCIWDRMERITQGYRDDYNDRPEWKQDGCFEEME